MKHRSSIVWKFYDRLHDETQRCIGVACKICNSQYKFFGNTTNLRVHMLKKHPIQWEMGQNGNFDEALRVDDSSNQALIGLGRKRILKKEKNVDVLESDQEFNEDDEATINMVREMHAEDSDEEWLDESFVQRGDKKTRKTRAKKIKREVLSPTPKRQSSTYYVQSPIKYGRFDSTFEDVQKDEHSVFGEYIANKIRNIKNDKTRCNIQQIITTIFWQAEYGMYDSADSVKKMLLFSVEDIEIEKPVTEANEELGEIISSEQI